MTPGQGREGPRRPRAKRRSDLARRLTSERERRELTQQQAADLVGVDLATFARWERGRTEPRGRLIVAAVERFLAGEGSGR
jgi:transcriptional regulator with XRE-family HTH domain